MRWGTYSDVPLPGQVAELLEFQSLMRWGTYSDKMPKPVAQNLQTCFNRSCVGEPIPTGLFTFRMWMPHMFQSLMRWGTYSDWSEADQ